MNRIARSRHAALTVTLFGLGAAIMIAFDHPATLGIGLALMIAFVVNGISLICRPDFLRDDSSSK